MAPAGRPPARVVGVALASQEVLQIDQQEEQFMMSFTLVFKWQDQQLQRDLEQKQDLEEALKRDQSLWSQYWDPQLDLKNCVRLRDNGKVRKSVEDAMKGMVQCTVEYAGVFQDAFPLQHFPFDRLLLRIHMGSACLTEDELRFVPMAYRPARPADGAGLVSTDWQLVDTRATISMPESAPGQPPGFCVMMRAQRDPGLHLRRFVLPTAMLALSNLATCLMGVKPRAVSLRLQYIITLVLSMQAMSVSSTKHFPTKPYRTWADGYNMATSLLPFVTLLETVGVSLIATTKAKLAGRLDAGFFAMLYGVWALLHAKLVQNWGQTTYAQPAWTPAPLSWREVFETDARRDVAPWDRSVHFAARISSSAPSGVNQLLEDAEGQYDMETQEVGSRPLYKKQAAQLWLRYSEASSSWQLSTSPVESPEQSSVVAAAQSSSITPTGIPAEQKWVIKYCVPKHPGTARHYESCGISITAEKKP